MYDHFNLDNNPLAKTTTKNNNQGKNFFLIFSY